MTEKIDKNSIVWAFALVMLVLNIVLGLRAVIDSRLSEEVAKQKLEIVELRSDVKSLSEKVGVALIDLGFGATAINCVAFTTLGVFAGGAAGVGAVSTSKS